jgi:hypothetical protein
MFWCGCQLFESSAAACDRHLFFNSGASGGILLTCSSRIPRKPPFKSHDGGTVARPTASITLFPVATTGQSGCARDVRAVFGNCRTRAGNRMFYEEKRCARFRARITAARKTKKVAPVERSLHGHSRVARSKLDHGTIRLTRMPRRRPACR